MKSESVGEHQLLLDESVPREETVRGVAGDEAGLSRGQNKAFQEYNSHQGSPDQTLDSYNFDLNLFLPDSLEPVCDLFEVSLSCTGGLVISCDQT